MAGQLPALRQPRRPPLTAVHHRVPRPQGIPATEKGAGPVGRAASLRRELPQKVRGLGPGERRRPANGPHEVAESDDSLQNAAGADIVRSGREGVGRVDQSKVTDSWDHSLPCSTTLIGAEGLYKDSYDHLYDQQGIDLSGDSTYKVNRIDAMLRSPDEADSTRVFGAKKDEKGNGCFELTSRTIAWNQSR